MVSDLFDNNPQTFIPIYYHLNGVPNQPWCFTRANFYTLQYTPYLWLDGSYDAGYTYTQWNSDFATHSAVSTDVSIAVESFRAGDRLDTRASVCIDAAGTGKDLRLYFVQVLDHYPVSPTYYRNAFRQVSTEDVTVAAGACVDAGATMTLKTEDMAQTADIGIVVWAQEQLASAPAEIYQATAVFDTPGMFVDGFETSDTSNWE